MSKFTVEFNKETNEFLNKIAQDKGCTKAEVIRRALASYNFLNNAVKQKKGLKISVTTDKDVVVKDIILP